MFWWILLAVLVLSILILVVAIGATARRLPALRRALAGLEYIQSEALSTSTRGEDLRHTIDILRTKADRMQDHIAAIQANRASGTR